MAMKPGRARHVDDAAATAFAHGPAGGARQHEHARGTMTSNARSCTATSGSVSGVCMPKPALLTSRSTGRVGVFEPGGDPVDVGTVGEVGGEHLDVTPEARAARSAVSSRRVDVTGDEDEVPAPLGELAGEFGTDAGRAPGDERYSHAAYDTVLRGTLRASEPAEHAIRHRTPRSRGSRS